MAQDIQTPSRTARRGLNVTLGPAALSVACVGLAIVLGWCFYMGYMIGRGQNPEEHMARIAAIWHEGGGDAARTADGAAGGAPNAEGAAVSADAGQAGQPGQAAQPGQPGQPGQGQAGQPGLPAQTAGQPPRVTGYPVFTTGGGQTAQAPQTAQTQAAQGGKGAQPAKEASGEPTYTFVYRMATVRSQEDARSEQERYEAKGFRVSIRRSGKAWALQHTFRGTDADAEVFLQSVKQAGLGEPLRVSRRKN